MRKAILIVLMLIFASTISAADNPAQKSKAKKIMDNYVAVFDLEVSDGVNKSISRPLSESIRRELVSTGKYDVIDRGNMNKILGEQKFQMSGCVQGECIVEAGQLLGVGKIIAGTVSLVGKTYYLSLSLINVETGKIEKVSEDKCKCEVDDLIDSSKRLAKKLMGEKAKEDQSAGNISNGQFLFNSPTFAGGSSRRSCNSCHPNGNGLKEVGIKKEFKIMGKTLQSLEDAVNFCIEMALKGKRLEKNSTEMKDIVAFIKSIH